MLTKILGKLSPRPIPFMLYRYVGMEILRPFFGAALFFLFILMMFQVIRLADFLVVHNVSGFVILRLLSFLAVTFVPITVPIAFLLAVLLGFGRLSTDSEVTAMRASGLSVYSMLVPALIIGILISAFSLFSNFYVVPWGGRMFRYELFRISNTRAIATIHEGTFTDGFFDLVVYANKVDSKTNTMQDVLLYDERKGNTPVTIVAKRGMIMSNYQDAKGIPGLMLRLFDGNLNRSTPGDESYELTQFETYDIFLKIETSRVVGVERPKTMDIGQLARKISDLRKIDKPSNDLAAELRSYRVEYWQRYALAVACIVFAIMGVAFGVVRTRTVRSNSFIICLFVLLSYWGVNTQGEILAQSGKIPAFIGMWAANLLLFIISIFVLRRVAR